MARSYMLCKTWTVTPARDWDGHGCGCGQGLEEQLSSVKAENFSLACQHRAGLQRLEEVLAEDSRLRVQLEDRCVVIRRLEAVCLELEASSVSAKRPQHVCASAVHTVEACQLAASSTAVPESAPRTHNSRN